MRKLAVLLIISLIPAGLVAAKKKKIPSIVGVGGGFTPLKFDSTLNGETIQAEGNLIITELIMGAHQMAKTMGLGYRSAFSARAYIAPSLASEDGSAISGGLWSIGGSFTTLLTYNYREAYGGLGQRFFVGLKPGAENAQFNLRLDLPLVIGYRLGKIGLEAEGNFTLMNRTNIGSHVYQETAFFDKGASLRAIVFL